MIQRALVCLLLFQLVAGSAFGLTPSEEKRLFELLGEIKGRLQQVDRRISELREDMNRRFEEMRQDINKRFEEMRQDTNKRFEEMRQDTNKRFEQVDKRLGAQLSFLWMLTGIFSTITAAVIALLLWDRRTAIRHALKESEGRLEERYGLGLLRKVVAALRERARTDGELATILKDMGLL